MKNSNENCIWTLGTLFRYLQLGHCNEIENKREVSAEGNKVYNKLFTIVYRCTHVNIVSKLYGDLQKQNGRNSFHVKSKWELELSEGDWHSICRSQQTSTSLTNWREFGKKILIYVSVSHHTSKNKQTGQQRQCWRKCEQMSSNLGVLEQSASDCGRDFFLKEYPVTPGQCTWF